MLAALHTRLSGTLTRPVWDQVLLAEDLDILVDLAGRVKTTTAIITPLSEQATPSPLSTGGFRQRVTVEFITAIALREYGDALGGDRAQRLDALKAEMEAALAGWEGPGMIAPCELFAAESSRIVKGVSLYAQTWQTARFLTGDNP